MTLIFQIAGGIVLAVLFITVVVGLLMWLAPRVAWEKVGQFFLCVIIGLVSLSMWAFQPVYDDLWGGLVPYFPHPVFGLLLLALWALLKFVAPLVIVVFIIIWGFLGVMYPFAWIVKKIKK